MSSTINFNPAETKDIPEYLKEKWKKLEVLDFFCITKYYLFIGEILCLIFENAEPYLEIIQSEGSVMHSNVEFKIGTKDIYFYYCYEGSVDENLHGYKTYTDIATFCNLSNNIKIETTSNDGINSSFIISGISDETADEIMKLRNLLFK